MIITKYECAVKFWAHINIADLLLLEVIMKKYAKANEVRISEITPKGWLREVLVDEKNGMTGNLHKIGYPFNTECWKYKSRNQYGCGCTNGSYCEVLC